ncbi:SAP domain-containing protein [Candidatus Poseidoniaceae archaeon]|nr:SAP domain-containing protein [Candidatus Poseidoniaceae archaeon]
MVKDDLSSLTVPQLKEKLKSNGLPVSGKKSELISRLNANSESNNSASNTSKPKSTAKPAPTKTSDSEGDLPFFQSIAANGIASVEIDKWEAGKYGMAVIIFFVMISALGSDTWYTGSHSFEYDEEFFGESFSGTESTEINYGLGELKYKEKITGDMSFSQTVTIEYSEDICESAEDLQCGKMSTAGTIIQITFWLSLLIVTSLLIIAVARGFGQLQTGAVDENYSKIQFWGWNACVALPSLGVIIYALITFSFDTGELFEGEGSFGLGSTWWMMFFMLAIFAASIHNSIVKKMVELVKAKMETK